MPLIPDIYLINLASRPDRLHAMQKQFDRVDLKFKRIDAVYGKDLAADTIHSVHRRGPLGELSFGDIGCFLSHRKAWQALVDSEKECALIVEDDVIFGERLKQFLEYLPNRQLSYDIFKLDRHGNSRHQVLLAKHEERTSFGSFRGMLSKHTGGSAYVITRHCAQKALDRSCPFTISVDHFLFNRNNSKFAHQILVQQLIPAAVRQGLIENDLGDIHRHRLAQRTYDFKYWKREAIRGLYEFSDIPAIIWNMIKGARFQKITFNP